MNNEFKRMQELSGVPVKEEKENLNEHYVAGGIVGVGAINNPFEGRKKESYEDAFEYFLEKKYSLKEAEEEVMVDSGMIKSYIDEMVSLADDMEYTPEMVKGLQDLKAKLSGGKMSVKDALSKMEEIIGIARNGQKAVEALSQAVKNDKAIVSKAKEISGLNEGEVVDKSIYDRLKDALFDLYRDLKGKERVEKIEEIIKQMSQYIYTLENEKTAKQS